MTAAEIKTKALQLGFHIVGIAPAMHFPEADLYQQWVYNGYAAEMGYLQRNIEKRLDCRVLFPPARSVIVCGMSYHSTLAVAPAPDDPARGRIARYAWGDDYHVVLKQALDRLLDEIRNVSPQPVAAKVCVDTAPLLERLYGYYAGLGWIGKHTCLINQRYGSWFVLGAILLDSALEYDTPMTNHCGDCTRCLDACPTGALVAPRTLDARRCLSYLTIEQRGDIPKAFHSALGVSVFGCDRCQEACPWNQSADAPGVPAFLPREHLYFPTFDWLLTLTPDSFQTTFRNSPIARATWQGLRRKTEIARRNARDEKNSVDRKFP